LASRFVKGHYVIEGHFAGDIDTVKALPVHCPATPKSIFAALRPNQISPYRFTSLKEMPTTIPTLGLFHVYQSYVSLMYQKRPERVEEEGPGRRLISHQTCLVDGVP
jgi:hypothetical protein